MSDNPYTRVYHPRANAWRDVPTDQVSGWTEQGWATKKHEKIDSEEVEVEVGSRIPAAVPVDDEPTPSATSSGAPAGDAARDEWVRYATDNGATPESVEGMTRNEIRDAYAPADN